MGDEEEVTGQFFSTRLGEFSPRLAGRLHLDKYAPASEDQSTQPKPASTSSPCIHHLSRHPARNPSSMQVGGAYFQCEVHGGRRDGAEAGGLLQGLSPGQRQESEAAPPGGTDELLSFLMFSTNRFFFFPVTDDFFYAFFSAKFAFRKSVMLKYDTKICEKGSQDIFNVKKELKFSVSAFCNVCTMLKRDDKKTFL